MLFGWPHRDINFSFKLMKREVLEAVELKSEGSLIDAELIVKAKNRGFTIQQIGLDYFPRIRGESHLSSPRVIFKIFRELMKLYPEMRERVSHEEVERVVREKREAAVLVAGTTAVLHPIENLRTGLLRDASRHAFHVHRRHARVSCRRVDADDVELYLRRHLNDREAVDERAGDDAEVRVDVAAVDLHRLVGFQREAKPLRNLPGLFVDLREGELLLKFHLAGQCGIVNVDGREVCAGREIELLGRLAANELGGVLPDLQDLACAAVAAARTTRMVTMRVRM